jgi:hypothetical protein
MGHRQLGNARNLGEIWYFLEAIRVKIGKRCTNQWGIAFTNRWKAYYRGAKLHYDW